MVLLSFSFQNLLYIGLLALTTTAEMFLISKIDTSQLIFMFLDSIALFSFVLVEDLIMYMTTEEKFKEITKTSIFNKKAIQKIRPANQRAKEDRSFFIGVSIISVLTTVIIGCNYFIYLCLFIGIGSVFWVATNLLTWLLLFFISKQKMFRHHGLALAIFIASLILALLETQIYDSILFYTTNYWSFCLIFALMAIAIPLREILEKYVLERLFVKYSKLFFYEGCGSLILTLLIFGIIQLVDCGGPSALNEFCLHNKNIYLLKQFTKSFSFRSITTLYIWLYFIAFIGTNCFRILINQKDGPSHRYSSDILAFALYMIIDVINTVATDSYQIFDWKMIVISIALIIGSLLYNENLRINACQFSCNTRYEIERRAKKDSEHDQELLNVIDEEIDIADLNKTFDDSIVLF